MRYAFQIILLQETSHQTVGHKPEVHRVVSAPEGSGRGSQPPLVPPRRAYTTLASRSQKSLGEVQAVECKPTETKQVTKVGIPPYQQMSLHTASVSASVPHNEVDEQASSAAQHVSDPTEQAVVSPVRRRLRRAYSIKYVELDFPSQPCQSQLLPHVPHQSSDYKTLYAQIDHIIADEDGREIPVILDNDTSSDEEFDCDEPLTFIALQKKKTSCDDIPRFLRGQTPCESDIETPHSELSLSNFPVDSVKGHRPPPPIPQIGVAANEDLEADP